MSSIVHVVVFTNFEGAVIATDSANNAVAWFEDCLNEHPEIRWTHLYSPSYLLVHDHLDAIFTPYLLSVIEKGAEIGIHAHLWFDMIEEAGVTPILAPSGEFDDCNQASDRGYGVAGESFSNGPTAAVIKSFLRHVKGRSDEDVAEIRFSTASEVAEHFFENTTIGHVSESND